MESKNLIIDGRDKNGEFKTLENIKNFNSVENIKIKNLNSLPETNWSLINKFSNLKTLNLSNCFVDKKLFFDGISTLTNLSELCVDDYCFFKDSEEKIDIKKKFSNIKKFIFVLTEKKVPNFDLPGIKELKDNFIQKYPNFPKGYDGLEEIEFVNYENYLEKIKKDDPYNEYTDPKEIYAGSDFYNLSRLKNLKNINFSGSTDELIKSNLIIDKIFNFPNHKKIKINHLPISQIKEKFTKGNLLYLDFTYVDYEERNQTNVNSHSTINDAIEVHYPSQHYNGYTDRFNRVLKHEIKHVIIGPTYDFLKDSLDEYDLRTIDFVKDKILKIKSLETITFDFDEST